MNLFSVFRFHRPQLRLNLNLNPNPNLNLDPSWDQDSQVNASNGVMCTYVRKEEEKSGNLGVSSSFLCKPMVVKYELSLRKC